MKNGDFKTAESYYKKAINEGSIDAMLELGTIYTSQLNIKEAEKLYLKAVKNNSEDGYNYLASDPAPVPSYLDPSGPLGPAAEPGSGKG